MMPRLRTVLVTATLGLVVLSCREGVAPFTPDELDRSDAALVRLTFNAGDERDPQWSAGGDTVYFHSDQWHALPGYRGTLLQVPADGGTATPLSPVPVRFSEISLRALAASASDTRVTEMRESSTLLTAV